MPRRPRSILLCKAVPGKRPRLRNEVRNILAELCVSGMIAKVNVLVGPVPLLCAAAFPALEARCACLGLLSRRLPRRLQTTTNIHAVCARAALILPVLTCRQHAC